MLVATLLSVAFGYLPVGAGWYPLWAGWLLMFAGLAAVFFLFFPQLPPRTLTHSCGAGELMCIETVCGLS